MRSVSFARITSECWRVWKRDFRALTILSAALELPLLLADVLLHVIPGLNALTTSSATVNTVLVLLLVYGSLSHHFLAGLLERVVGSERHGHRRPTLDEVLVHLPWRRLIVADLLLTAMVAVGLVAFVIPGLVVLTWFAVVLPIVNLEGRSVLASFRRSYHLVRGHSWRVGVVALSAFALPEFIIAMTATLVDDVSDDVIMNALAHAVPSIILMPIAALPIVVLAFDLVDLDKQRSRQHPPPAESYIGGPGR